MFRILSRTALAVVLVATSSLASSQVTESNSKEQDAAAEPAPPPAQPTFIQLPALTPVGLMVLDPVTSKTALPGSPVRLALARPLYLTSELGLPAGTPVEGVVIHAAKGGMGGKPGELLLGARRIVLRHRHHSTPLVQVGTRQGPE